MHDQETANVIASAPGAAILNLDLTRHCIETDIRHQYNRAVSACLRSSGDPDRLEPVIDLALKCLERLDFAELRRRYPPLAGHDTAEVVVSGDGEDIRIAIDGSPVAPVFRDRG